ncbi:hypothetical protein ACH5RR_023269 [Cinchona calisaya]|uniref:Uncharacterized protein n=1 Tax=Cinchona calisaya TaxID=153742 RepID=A0ABD2ZDB7_9GENT
MCHSQPPSQHPMLTRSRDGTRKARTFLATKDPVPQSFLSILWASSSNEPTSYRQALKDDKWKAVMEDGRRSGQRGAAEEGGNKVSTYEYAWQSFKQRGWAVHFIDFTSLYLRLKIGAGRAVKAHLVDSERVASTYSYQNEKKQIELEEMSLYQRMPLRASPLYRALSTRAPLNYKLSSHV